MPTNNPLRTANSAMAKRGANPVVLLDNGSYPGFSEFLNETWTWNGTDWTRAISAIGSGPLPTRADFSLTYDGYNIMMFGGRSDAETQSDTWTYNGTAWTKEAPVTVPFGRFRHKLAYLNGGAGAETAVMFGGSNMNEVLNETWVWNGSAKTWTLAAPVSKPPARIDFMFSGNTTVCVLFGGKDQARLFADTWTWNGTTWTQNTPTTPPGYRSNAGFCYDVANSEWVMFGGSDTFNTLGETWTLNAGRTAWTKEAPATSPPARVNPTMYYDGTRVVMTGGTDGFSDYAFNDTWGWNGTTWTAL